MSVTVTVVIECCSECSHSEPCSAYEGGIGIICGHDDICHGERTDWFKRKIRHRKKIPGWCPLKHGSAY